MAGPNTSPKVAVNGKEPATTANANLSVAQASGKELTVVAANGKELATVQASGKEPSVAAV